MSSSALKMVNPKADAASSKGQALAINTAAAKGLAEVLRTNLGPTGTMKMLVDGAGDVRLTKDGNSLLGNMQIQHPTATLISRAATAQDEMVGDGTSTAVVFIGELLKQSDRYLSEGVHPRLMAEGFDIAKQLTIDFLEKFKIDKEVDRELLISVARTSLRTKVHRELADLLTEIVVDAVLTIRREDEPIDLHMVEVQSMKHRLSVESKLVKGIVFDHGARHPDMPKRLTNCFVFACNVELEYEKTEVNSSFFYNSAEQREKMVEAERKVVDERCKKIIELKRQVCDTPDKSFVVINMRGIDPMSLDMFAKEGIIALRRAKRRNMERLALAAGSSCVQAIDDSLSADCLGRAGLVYEYTLGEDKFTFMEEMKDPNSCTVLIRGPNSFTINLINESLRDGLRAVKNTLDAKNVVPGAGAFEIACAEHLRANTDKAEGRAKLGIEVFAESLMVVPKALAENSGHDAHDVIIKMKEALAANPDGYVGFDISTGDTLDPEACGIYDTFLSKRHMVGTAPVIANQLLMVDEILRAGRKKEKSGM
jgi:T-complex protein 1 subunit zeta